MSSRANNSLLERFFLLIVFLLPFSFALNPLPNVDLSIIRILVPAIFLWWLIDSLIRKKIVIDTRLRFFLLLLFILFFGLSFFWATDQARAIRKIIFLFSIFPIYFVAFSLQKNSLWKERFSKTLLWSGFVLSVFALAQFSTQFFIGLDPAIKLIGKYVAPFFLGQSFSEIVLAYPSWLVNIGGKTMMRAFGSLPDPHLFSLYLNMCLPFGIWLFKKTGRKIFLFFSAVILLASLLSFSRAGYLALGLSAIFYLLVFNGPKILIKKPIVSFLLATVAFVILVFPNPISHRIYSTFNLAEGSNSGRILMWQKAFQATSDHPYLGVGAGNFAVYVKPDASLREPIYAHNLLLDFAAENGVLSFSLLFAILLIAIFAFVKARTSFSKLASLSFFIFFVHSLFETPFYSVTIFPLFLILLAFDEKTD